MMFAHPVRHFKAVHRETHRIPHKKILTITDRWQESIPAGTTQSKVRMLLSYLSFFTFLSCITLGFINLFLDPRAKLNRAFFLLSASSAHWAFAYIFIFIAGDKETIWLWYRISAPGGLILCSFRINPRQSVAQCFYLI